MRRPAPNPEWRLLTAPLHQHGANASARKCAAAGRCSIYEARAAAAGLALSFSAAINALRGRARGMRILSRDQQTFGDDVREPVGFLGEDGARFSR